MRLVLMAALVAAFPFLAHAEWKPEYASQPKEIRDWYANAEVTEAGQKYLNERGFYYTKCCDHADVVKTKFEVNRTTGGDEWFYEDSPGHMKRIPPEIIHWGISAPGGQPTLFVYKGQETCFFPGGSGI